MSESLPSLAFENAPMVGASAFEGDALKREALASKLTGYIDRLKAGAVLAIDAPWGEGKSWFGKNWAKKLEEEHRVAYIDAFEQDYIEDPFLLLASELVSLTEDGSETKTELTNKAVNVAKATMSIGTKVGMGLVTKYLLGGVDLGDEIEDAISEASADTAQISSRLIEEGFEKYEQNKQTIAAFREELAKYAASQEKPIVIFVDELDRCKPDFAVGLIERIKHFFDVPNVVFVLLLNRHQLEKAVKGVYGAETDGAVYLGKFINFFFRLPKPKATSYNAERAMQKFVTSTFKKYKFPDLEEKTQLIDLVTFFSIQFDLSLRDIERAVALYAFAYPVRRLEQILMYFIVLKQKDIALFHRLVEGRKGAHKHMVEEMNNLIQIDQERGGTSHRRILNTLLQWHEAYENNFENVGEDFSKIYSYVAEEEYDTTPKQLFSYFAKMIDLSVEE